MPWLPPRSGVVVEDEADALRVGWAVGILSSRTMGLAAIASLYRLMHGPPVAPGPHWPSTQVQACGPPGLSISSPLWSGHQLFLPCNLSKWQVGLPLTGYLHNLLYTLSFISFHGRLPQVSSSLHLDLPSSSSLSKPQLGPQEAGCVEGRRKVLFRLGVVSWHSVL